MDMNNVNIEEIVKQVLAGMAGTAPAASASAAPAAPAAAPAGAIPKTAHVAVLTEKEHFDIKEYPIPAIGDDDILVKVEGCGVCGTDAHEFKRDPFNLIPVALGHEGTGEIVAMGKNVKTDTAGKPVKIGDKVVTCMIFKDDPEITMFDLNKKNVGGADVYGLLPDDDIHLNGWFSDYIFIRGGEFGSTFFNVSDLDLDSRILIEPCAVLVHAVERAKTTGILRFNSRVVVQGCGPIGLICIAVLRTMGIENICAVDGNQQRLDFAKRMGATMSVNFMEHKGIEALSEAVKDQFGGHLADFAFQCTGSPVAHANIYKFIRNGGGLCELGFFINGGDATINPHFDLCSKPAQKLHNDLLVDDIILSQEETSSRKGDLLRPGLLRLRLIKQFLLQQRKLQVHVKGSPLPLLTFHRDLPSHGGHQILCDRHAKACAFRLAHDGISGALKGHKDGLLKFRRHANSVIPDIDMNSYIIFSFRRFFFGEG